MARTEGDQGIAKKILKFVEKDVHDESRTPNKKKAAAEKNKRKGKMDLFDDVFAFTG